MMMIHTNSSVYFLIVTPRWAVLLSAGGRPGGAASGEGLPQQMGRLPGADDAGAGWYGVEADILPWSGHTGEGMTYGTGGLTCVGEGRVAQLVRCQVPSTTSGVHPLQSARTVHAGGWFRAVCPLSRARHGSARHICYSQRLGNGNTGYFIEIFEKSQG